MRDSQTRKKAKSAAAKTLRRDVDDLNNLANDFLDLWQANLLAWASDPVLSPALAPAPDTQRKPAKGPPHDP